MHNHILLQHRWQNLKKLVQHEQKLESIGKTCRNRIIAQCQLEYDFTLQNLSDNLLKALVQLADECDLEDKRQAYFLGRKINVSQNRQVLHTALRSPVVINENRLSEKLAQSIEQSLNQMIQICSAVRQNRWLDSSSSKITDIVNIGIGGSDLGPKMSVTALKEFRDTSIAFHFISDANPESFNDTVEKLNPATTLFIVSSKSFTTRETLQNANKAKQWLDNLPIDKHMLAVTANAQLAQKFGISTILPIWDWVGGRFSLCSAINLILMIAIGPDAFMQLLEGAHCMDEHFLNTAFENNMPVMLAMCGILNVNVRQLLSHCVLTYHSRLELLLPYLQQLEMESNGKSVDLSGNKINHATCPIIWGGLGNRAQHAYYQLLAQGTHKFSADFILDASKEQELVTKFALNKMKILACGEHTNDHYHISGGVPINKITINSLTPYTLGALIALYEHKVFVQGVIWNINSFDQFGVESSKRLDLDPIGNRLQHPNLDCMIS